MVWCMPWHRFDAEFRAYVIDGVVVGVSNRYDDGPMDDSQIQLIGSVMHECRGDHWLRSGATNAAQVMASIWKDRGAPSGYAIDVGYTIKKDKFNLIEVNDGWALGLYNGSKTLPRLYCDLLRVRWNEMIGHDQKVTRTREA